MATIPFWVSIENCGLNSASFFYKSGKDSIISDSLASSTADAKSGPNNSGEEIYTILGMNLVSLLRVCHRKTLYGAVSGIFIIIELKY